MLEFDTWYPWNLLVCFMPSSDMLDIFPTSECHI